MGDEMTQPNTKARKSTTGIAIFEIILAFEKQI